jgi:hypothetical protein
MSIYSVKDLLRMWGDQLPLSVIIPRWGRKGDKYRKMLEKGVVLYRKRRNRHQKSHKRTGYNRRITSKRVFTHRRK